MSEMDLVEKTKLAIKKLCPRCGDAYAADDQKSKCARCSIPLITDGTDPFVGQIAAERYQIVERIGIGGWAVIYKAKQQPLNRFVAIKILHSHLAGDPEKVRRFRREAEAATGLVHENILSVFDYGVSHGQPYIVMEYLAGVTLGEVAKREGIVDLRWALDVFYQLCLGLQHAHERNVIHRDIKPNNIYLTENETRAKILDFGLAKLLSDDEPGSGNTLTQSGQTIGTPSYMSPEQCMGLPLDARSDVYSLGCVMYEILLGKRAFEGKSVFETMNLQLHQEPVFAAADGREKNIPADIQLIVMRALSKDPVERYQDAAELAAALRAVVQRMDGGQKKQVIAAQFENFARRQKQLFKRLVKEPLVVGISTASLATVAGGWWYFSHPHEPVNLAAIADQYQRHMADGQTAYYANNLPAANDCFTKAAKESETFGEADKRHLKALQQKQIVLGLLNDSVGLATVAQELDDIGQKNPGVMYGDEEDNAQEIRKLQKRFDANRQDKQIATQLAHVRNNQTQLYLTNARLEDAQNQTTQALALEKQAFDNDSWEYATTLSNVAYIEANTGKAQKAEADYRAVLDLRRKRFGNKSPLVARSLRNLGDFYYKQGDLKNAIANLSEALEIYQGNNKQADVAWVKNNLALVYMADKKLGVAQQLIDDALRIRTKLYGKEGIDVARSRQNLGLLDAMQGDLNGAIGNLQMALRIYEVKLGANHLDTLRCANNLAKVFMTKKDFAAALPLYKRIAENAEPGDSMAADAAASLEKIHEALGT